MPARVLETILTGRNLLSPVLANAGRDVVAFNSTVAGANAKAATSAQLSAGTQDGAAAKIAASNAKASTSAVASANSQARAHAKAAESATISARVQETANRSLAASNGLLGTSLTPLTAGLGAVGLGLAYAGYRGMEFGTAMSQVQAASQASAADMGRLKDAAIDAGAKTQYSAVEAAQGITEMSKAGVSARDILGGGLTGALNLAAAGQISVADAAETGATALSVFGLEGNKMSHVADLLAAGAGKAQGSVGDMSAALNQSALVAKQTGLSIEDTAGALAMFASNGLVGSDAGTSFKTMLQALTPNSKQAAQAMAEIGFSAYDSQGKFVGLEAVAGQLRTGLAGLTEEQRNSTLETIFGSDAVRAASVLYSQGAPGVAEWAGKVNDAGYAQRQAAQLTDNLRGDVEKLGGAFDSTMTSIGDGAQGPLRELVQALTTIVNAGGDVLGFFNGLPGPLQAAVVAFGAWTLVGGKVMGAVDGVRTRFIALREEQELQRALLAAQQGSTAATAGAYGTLAERIDATTGVTRGLGTGLDTVSTKAATAKAAVGGFARAIGPELGIAAAVYLVTQLVSGIISVATAGDAAADRVRDLNSAIKDSDSNPARFTALNTGLDDLKKKAADAQQILDDFNNQNFFNKNVWFGPGEAGEIKDAKESVEAYNAAIDKLGAANTRGAETSQFLAEKLHLSKDEVAELADKYKIDLTGGIDQTRAKFEAMYSTEYGTTPVDAANATGAAMVSSKAQTEEAAKALEDWINQLAEVGASFVEPLDIYKGLLQDAAQSTADSTKSSKDSWQDYADSASVSLDQFATKLEEQIVNQENWRTNLVTVAERAGYDVAAQLAAMGEQGVQLTAQMADGTDAEMLRMAGLLRRDAELGGAGAAAALDQQMKVMGIIGRDGAAATAQGIAQQLGIGVEQVRGIAAQYGINLAEGINPLLGALGKPLVRPPNNGQRAPGFADGGYTGDGDKYEPKGVVHAGEFVITKERTAKLGVRTLENLEKILPGYAGGGFVSGADVPRPPSTAPFGMPISTAGDAAMDTAYQATTKWIQETGPFGSALAFAKSQVGKPYIWGGVGPAGYDCSGFMSAITNVMRGRSPYSRVGATASFPWAGFAPGDGVFTIGSTPDAGGGVGHMAGTLMGVNVESRGGQGVVVGPSARGANNGLFTTRAHLTFDGGGLASGVGYLPKATVAPERVLDPRQTAAFEDWMRSPAAMPGYGAAASGGSFGGSVVVVNIDGAQITGTLAFDAAGIIRLVDGRVVTAVTTITERGRYNG